MHDPFSFTPKKSVWIDHELLSGIVFYLMHRSGGDAGLLLFRLFVSFLTLSFIYSACHEKSGKVSSLLFMLATIQMATVWLSPVRSQVFTYLFLAALLQILGSAYYRLRLLPLTIVPALFAIWCFMHGGFVVGLGFLGFFTLSAYLHQNKARHQLLATLLLSIAATALNPYGFLPYWQFVLEATTMARPAIDEWGSVMPWERYALIPNLFFLSLALLYLTQKRPVFEWVHILLVMSALFFGYRHYRLMPLFIMVSLVELHGLFFLSPDSVKRFCITRIFKPAARILAAVTPLLVLGAAYTLYAQHFFHLKTEAFPEAAVTWLKNNRPSGNILVHFDHGSFVLWKLYPAFKVSVDGRYEEVYPEETVQLADDALNPASRTQAHSLIKINPDLILADASSSFPNNWKKIYTDPLFAIFEKEKVPNT